MPFTPFHFGPGLFAKSILKKFSLTVFIFSQIIIDLEPLWFMLTDNPPVHRLLHTLMGSNIAVLISVVAGKPICEFGLRLLGKIAHFKREIKITWTAVFVSALVGAYSHVFLDSLMHRDMRPFAPFSQTNPFLHAVEISHLYQACLFAGAIGAVLYLIRNLKKEKS